MNDSTQKRRPAGMRWTLIALAALVAACGGGGDQASPGQGPNPDNGNGGGGGGNTGGGTGGVQNPPPAAQPRVPQAPQTERALRNQIAFTAAANAAARATPGQLGQAAVLVELLKSGQPIDAQRVASAFGTTRSQLKGWAGASTASGFDAEVQGLRQLGTALGQVPGGAAATFAAWSRTVGQVDDKPARDMAWRGARQQISAAVHNDLHSLCNMSSELAAVCNAVMSQVLGTAVTAEWTDTCARNRNLGGCEVLQRSSFNPAQARADALGRIETVQKAAVAESKACAANAAQCNQAPPLTAAAQLAENVSAVTRLANFANALDDRTTARVQGLATTAATIYDRARTIRETYRTLDPTQLVSKANWADVANLRFSANGTEQLLSAFTTVASIAASVYDIAGAVTAVMSLFGSQAGGNDAQIMAQLQAIQQTLDQMHTEMHGRFDVVDAKLVQINLSLVTGFDTLTRQAGNANTQLEDIRRAIGNIETSVATLAIAVEAYAQANSRNQLNLLITGLDSTINAEDFQRQVTQIFLYAKNTTVDATMAGAPGRDFGDGRWQELSKADGTLVNYLMEYPTRRFSMPAISGARVANPYELAYALRLYSRLVARYPEFARAIAPTIRGHIQNLLDERVLPVNAAVSGIQRSPALFEALVAELRQSASTLQKALDDHTATYLGDARVGPGSQAMLKLFPADPTQLSSFVPEAVNLGRIPSCNGNGSPLAMPANWRTVFGDPLAINAEALGLGQLSACYEFDPVGTNGWLSIWHKKHKVDRYTAGGAFQASFRIFINDQPVSARQLSVPDTSAGGPSTLCFFFTTDDVRVAHNAVPAWNVLAAAWQGTFTAPNWCNPQSAGNLREAYELRSVRTFDWASQAPASRQAWQEAVQARMTVLQRGLHSALAAELQSTGAIGKVARDMESARLALLRYCEFALRDHLEYSTLLRALLLGDEAVPSTAVLVAMYRNQAAQSASIGERLDIQAPTAALADKLTAVIGAISSAIARGEARDGISELAAAQAEVELLLQALGGS